MKVYIKKQNVVWHKVVITAFLLVVSVALLNVFQKSVRNSFFYISNPLSTVFLTTGKNTSAVLSSLLTFNLLKKENAALKNENQYLLANLFSLQEAIRQGKDSAVILENIQDDSFVLLQSNVAGLDAAKDMMFITRGVDDGIAENMPIISKEKVLLGRVSKVYANFSQIVFISALNSTFGVKVQTLSRDVTVPVYGAIKGQGNLSLYMDLISPNSKIEQGDILVTSGQEGIFPKDLLVGKIQTPNTSDATAFQTATVEPFFNLKNMENVFIITNYLRK